MKLLTVGDDYGFTKGVTLGIIEAIDHGVLRNTGLFTNMPSASLAAKLMKGREHVCFGIDFNIVSGKPVSNPAEIPHLVDENGEFIRSSIRIKDPRWKTEEGRREMFPYDEVYTELKAQYNKFLELTGKKPGYLHNHSISHESYREAIQALSKETQVPHSFTLLDQMGVVTVGLRKTNATTKKQFDPIEQLNHDPLNDLYEDLNLMLNSEYAVLGGHPGYVDNDLLNLSSLSLERCKDLEMMTSNQLKQLIEKYNIELITYYDLLKDAQSLFNI